MLKVRIMATVVLALRSSGVSRVMRVRALTPHLLSRMPGQIRSGLGLITFRDGALTAEAASSFHSQASLVVREFFMPRY